MIFLMHFIVIFTLLTCFCVYEERKIMKSKETISKIDKNYTGSIYLRYENIDTVKAQMPFENGRFTREYKGYYSNGNIMFQGKINESFNWINMIFYNLEGNIIKKIFRVGQKEELEKYYDDGKIRYKEERNGNNRYMEYYYPNWNLLGSFYKEDILLRNEVKLYYDNKTIDGNLQF